MVQPFEQTSLHMPEDNLFAISKNSVEQFWRRRLRYQRFALKFAMFKLCLAVIKILVLEKKIFKGLP